MTIRVLYDGTVIGVGAYVWNDVNIGNVMGVNSGTENEGVYI